MRLARFLTLVVLNKPSLPRNPKRHAAYALVTALALALPVSVDAATITYSSSAAFAAATQGLTTVDFEGIAPFGGFTLISGSTTLSGATFETNTPTSDGNLFIIGDSFYYVGTSVLSFQQSTTGQNSLRITFGAPVTAFGGLFGSFDGLPLSLSLSNGDSSTVPVPGFDLAFFGVTSDTPFNSLVLTGTSVNSASVGYNLDNVQFGSASASPVPEPASLTLLGLGLAGMGARRWRQRKA